MKTISSGPRVIAAVLSLILLTVCCSPGGSAVMRATAESTAAADMSVESDQWVEERLAELTLEEKISQLFFIVPDILTGTPVLEPDNLQDAIGQYPVGGFLLAGSNIHSETQLKTLVEGLKEAVVAEVGLMPFIGIDEEGGFVSRLGNSGLAVPAVPAMAFMRDADNAYEAGLTIGSYLAGYGFNVDFAPVLDVLVNPLNLVIGTRSFGEDAGHVSELGLAFIDGLHVNRIAATAKHFPGHGATAGDTHMGAAVSTRSAAAIRETELVPFIRAIDAGVEFIMVGHMSIPSLTGSDVPTSLSGDVITGLLRTELGYDGLVITDALNMQAITDYYTAGEAAILTLEAGCDILLAPSDLAGAFAGVQAAVQDGTLEGARIDQSVRRILALKRYLSD